MKKIITPEMSDPNDGSDNFTYSTEIEVRYFLPRVLRSSIRR